MQFNLFGNIKNKNPNQTKKNPQTPQKTPKTNKTPNKTVYKKKAILIYMYNNN